MRCHIIHLYVYTLYAFTHNNIYWYLCQIYISICKPMLICVAIISICKYTYKYVGNTYKRSAIFDFRCEYLYDYYCNNRPEMSVGHSITLSSSNGTRLLPFVFCIYCIGPRSHYEKLFLTNAVRTNIEALSRVCKICLKCLKFTIWFLRQGLSVKWIETQDRTKTFLW